MTTTINPSAVRAATSEKIWVVLTPIKADKRAAFEQFVQEILLLAVTRIAPNVHRHVRALYPTQP